MVDDVSEAEKTLRFLELENAQKASQAVRLERYLGRELGVLVESGSTRTEDGLTGHSTCHKVVNFVGDHSLVGEIVNIRINEVKTNSLFGELVN
jgi:tRNA-2-methylthio-N6-dimethylallyladenosine synthase